MSTNDVVISVRDISKCYRIGLKEKMHENLASAAFDFFKSPFTRYRQYRSLYNFSDTITSGADSEDIIWALKNVSFDVLKGEVLGIIGDNGAGKSTLLKILCKITDPTRGRAEIRGRVSSLLEVGTGFHQELTGRENVYLNATILGMKKAEVDRKFDEIVDFAGIEKYIDTPVKRYSSGMRVRLAFSVAAHLEPQIMIIDEVLAVGDAEFQKKCMGKMEAEARQGRTILLVSHNMGAISKLCARALWLDKGQIRLEGPPSIVVGSYLSSNIQKSGSWQNQKPPSGDTVVQIKSATILSAENEPVSLVEFGKEFGIEIVYEVMQPAKYTCIVCQLTDSYGNTIWTSCDTDIKPWDNDLREPGLYISKCIVPATFTRPGHYTVTVGAMVPGIKWHAFHGEIPSPINPPSGCRFHTRCPQYIGDICRMTEPRLVHVGKDRYVACHLYSEKA